MLPPKKTTSKPATQVLKQTTLLGRMTRGPAPAHPRAMRMEVLISLPPNFKRKQIAEEKFTNNTSTLTPQATKPDSGNEGPPRRKRRLRRARRPLSSEEECSGDEVESEHILESRLRTRGKLTQRDRILQKLKRKRQGLSPPKLSSSGSEEESDSDSSSPFKGAKRHSDRDSLFDGSSESGDSADTSEFIVEDTGPSVALPTQFSMDAHEDLSFQFKKIFQFMVHIAVHPPAERKHFMRKQMKNEEYFSIPLNVARRKIEGLRDSLVASSRWQPHFIALLKKYPDFEEKSHTFSTPRCDACRINKRISKNTGHLSGFPYDPMGFQELTDLSSETSDDEGDDPRYKKSGNTISFHVGRFCLQRTKVFHDFCHWEYKLFRVISQEVDELHEAEEAGGRIDDRDRFVRVIYEDGKQPPKDLQDADGINDWLVSRHIVDIEWAKIEKMMEAARHLEIASKRGDTD
ncbi:hypothetical protein B0H10DRAFT_1983301 [Mycena sp. CBHHK59/15]|nr:hypothetical protein B0H10DRAFT_1983301 [Mycena sp. CBHHK59/15]